MSLLCEYLPWFWFGLVIIFTLIEVFTFGLATIWFAIGALLMMFLSFFPVPFVWQVLLFLLISSLLLIFTRPIAVKKLKVGREKTNTDALIGLKALVVKDILEFDKGLVKVNGVEWSAKSIDNKPLLKDSTCVIEQIEGVTLWVRAIEPT